MGTYKKRSKTHRRKVRTFSRKLRKTKSSRRRNRKNKKGGTMDLNLQSYRGMTLPQFRGLSTIGRHAEFLEAPIQNTARS